MFRPTPLHERHDLFQRIADQLPEVMAMASTASYCLLTVRELALLLCAFHPPASCVTQVEASRAGSDTLFTTSECVVRRACSFAMTCALCPVAMTPLFVLVVWSCARIDQP